MVGGWGLKSIRLQPRGINQCDRARERLCQEKEEREGYRDQKTQCQRTDERERERNWVSGTVADCLFLLEILSDIVQKMLYTCDTPLTKFNRILLHSEIDQHQFRL